MAWDIVARALFTDNGATAGLAKLNAEIHDVAKAAPGGTRAFSVMERGLSTLAFEAAGVTGPMGRIAESLLKFGGGSTLVLGAAAGIGLIAEAWKASAAEADRAVDAMIDARKRLAGVIAKAGSDSSDEMRAQFRRAIDEAKAQLDSLQRAPLPTTTQYYSGGVGAPSVAVTTVDADKRVLQVEALRGKIADLTNQLALMGQKAEDAAERGLRELRDQLANINSEITGFLQKTPFIQETLQNIHIPTLGELQGQERARQVELAVARKASDEISFGLIGVGMGRTSIIGKQEPKTKDKLDAAQIAAESVALIGALRSGGFGGALSSAGALTSTLGAAKSAGGLGIAALGPVGLGLQVAGGLFGLFDNSAERRHKEMMRELKRIAEKPNPEPVRVQPILVGANASNAADVAYQVGRLQDRDAIPRGVGG